MLIWVPHFQRSRKQGLGYIVSPEFTKVLSIAVHSSQASAPKNSIYLCYTFKLVSLYQIDHYGLTQRILGTLIQQDAEPFCQSSLFWNRQSDAFVIFQTTRCSIHVLWDRLKLLDHLFLLAYLLPNISCRNGIYQ